MQQGAPCVMIRIGLRRLFWANLSRGLFREMTSVRIKAKIVRVTVEKGHEGLLYAQSPDLKGLLVANATFEGLREEIPIAIAEMFEACDTPVIVTEIDDDDECAWVAVPKTAA